MTPRLDVAGVSKAFGRHRVLDQASVQVRAGEAVGLLGANGAGKTTLLRVAAGLMRPDAGGVRWLPSEPFAVPSVRYFGGEGTLPPTISARRWASLFSIVAAERRAIGRLSRGSRQGLGLRVFLAGDPTDIVLLDEPWEGLDPPGAAWLTDTLRRWQRAGSAILLSSHRLYDLDSICTRFVMLEDGRCSPLVARDERPRLEQIQRAFVRGGR
ncbi:MAG TPA: ATP-binding cassette domain-containing protein [Vicinamibacterales bacterium]